MAEEARRKAEKLELELKEIKEDLDESLEETKALPSECEEEQKKSLKAAKKKAIA